MRFFIALCAIMPLSTLAAFINVTALGISLVPRAPQNPTSLNALCGANSMKNATCLGSTFGSCCSEKGYCGSTSIYCDEGCQPGFGTCTSASPNAKQIVSTSGNCGLIASSNITCIGASMGSCCSSGGYCGSTSAYCGEGCQAGFGKCDEAHLSVQVVSSSGACGITEISNTTCIGFEKGSCCSAKGWCGKDSSYCGTGCQAGFGDCGIPFVDTTTSLKPTQLPSSTLSTPASITLSTTSSTSPTSSLSTVSSIESLQSSTPVKTGTSLGTIAGATVGSIAGVAIIVAMIFFILRRRRRNNNEKESTFPKNYDNLNGHYDPKISSPTTTNSEMKVSPLTPIQKLGGNERLYEIGDGQRAAPVELEGPQVERSKEEIERLRIARMNDRLAAGYDGAYRGN